VDSAVRAGRANVSPGESVIVMAKFGVKPGSPAPQSGQYVQQGPRGGLQSTEITSTEGNPMPPTSKPSSTWVLVDPTKHKGS